MVTIDIKKLLRDERQLRAAPTAKILEQNADESDALKHPLDLDSFAVGREKLQASCAPASRTSPAGSLWC